MAKAKDHQGYNKSRQLTENIPGYKGYECQCADSESYGALCGQKAEQCSVEDISIDHVTEMVPLPGYRGSDLLQVQCQEGYELKGQLPR